MRSCAESPPRDGLPGLLRLELQVDPARWRSMLRITACTVVMLIVTMTFRIPLPAYAIYIVFVVSQSDAASTLITAIGGTLAITLAVSLSILLYVFDAGAPALRIPLLALSAFLGPFLARTSSLGPVAFLSGYVLVLTQTLLDESPATEPVVHGVLWLWVIVVVPVMVTVAVTLATGERPATLARRQATAVLAGLAAYLEHPGTQDPQRLRGQLVALEQLKTRAQNWDRRLQVFALEDNAMLALLMEALDIAVTLPADTPQGMRRELAGALQQAGRHLLARRRGQAPSGHGERASASPNPDRPNPGQPRPDQPTALALQQVIDELLLRSLGHGDATALPDPPAPRAFFIADAFRNREHARFAVKVMLAVLGAYATYTLLDWPGIRTAVTTCFFVSMTTFGESLHKFTLRISGALIGGLLAGLCLVFVLPRLDDIGQFCLVMAAVSLFAAWISTGSEAISYAGMQIAFAFFLGTLQGFAPASDLTVLRDRVVGILIGNAWVTLMFASLWPVSTATEIRRLQASMFSTLAARLRQDASEPSRASSGLALGRQRAHADQLRARSHFEWRPVSHDRLLVDAAAADRIVSHARVLLRLRQTTAATPDTQSADADIAAKLDALVQPQDHTDPASRPPATSTNALSRARRQLLEDIDHAMHAH
ncbi:FUSC family protein [Dyella sp. A6]|uniref:FUSC family protein n=1 Tax=Dyella aluminiiresistens TaxID=3069105 RepID=UPI002E77D36B|nr:FUSC family protein [Dyella sp. A6]